MSFIESRADAADVLASLDRLTDVEAMQPNCMFQLALMVARIAIEPGPETFKEECAQALLEVVRAKPKSNVVRLFGDRPKVATPISGLRDAG